MSLIAHTRLLNLVLLPNGSCFFYFYSDVELKNIIDKLANFVARNGPEFEQMTMNKQRDNAKFHFLFGGEWHAYYKWRVMTEHGTARQTIPLPFLSVGESETEISRTVSPAGGGGGFKQQSTAAPGIPPLMPQSQPPQPLMSMSNYASQPPPNMPPFPPPLFGGPQGYIPRFMPNMPPLPHPPPLLPPSAPSSSQSQPPSLMPPGK